MSKASLLTDQHRRNQVRLAITADSQARRAWDKTLDMSDLRGSQPAWKQAVTKLLSQWFNISAQTAAQYLPRYREAALGDNDDGFTIELPRFDAEAVGEQLDWMGAINVMWHLAKGDTQEAAWQAARSMFLGMFHEMVLTGGRQTVQEWAKQDAKCIGWRRVSDGNPCAFCAMLVSRGPVYRSEFNALHSDNPDIPEGKYHRNCGCTCEPIYGDWKPTEQEQQWIDQYYDAAEQFPKGERTWDNILPVMRENGDFRDSLINTVPWPEEKAQRLSRKTLNHILYGEGDDRKQGGHLYGIGKLDKTEFPESWGKRRIIEALGEVLANPFKEIPPKNLEDTYANHYILGVVDDVKIEILAKKENGIYKVLTAYPVSGPGVIQNTKDGRIEIATLTHNKKRWKGA